MQRAYSLQPNEQQEAAALEAEHRNLLAQYGALMIDKARIKKALPASEEKQRQLLRRCLERHGVTQFNAARMDGMNILVDLPDEAALAPVGPVPVPPHVNGKAEPASSDLEG